jgi:hypothetical protein
MSGSIGKSRYTESDIETIAASVVRIINQSLAGRDKYEISSWLLACESLEAKARRVIPNGKESGWYHPPTRTIYYHTENTPHQRIRIFAHELAHHVQCIMPFLLASQTRLERYDDNYQSVQHRVAQRVETLILGEIDEE